MASPIGHLLSSLAPIVLLLIFVLFYQPVNGNVEEIYLREDVTCQSSDGFFDALG